MGGTVFFDYDGTLHDSMHLYGPAFRRAYAALVTDGWAAPRTFSDEEIASWLGYSPAAMWASFMPELPEAIWQRASAAIGEEMRRLLAAGAGRLYPGAKAMLESLREEGCTLVFLSNCSGAYRDEHLAAFGLGGLFAGLLSNAGIGLLVLLRTNRNWKENAAVVAILYGFSVLAGIAVTLLAG